VAEENKIRILEEEFQKEKERANNISEEKNKLGRVSGGAVERPGNQAWF